MESQRPALGIIGAGKVGCTLARLFYAAGYAVRAVYSRSPDHARALARLVGAEAVDSASAAAQASDLILLTVPDDTIAIVAARFDGVELRDKGIVHTSGVRDASALQAAAERGALVGSLHPAFPFVDVEASIARLPGAAFAVEAEDERLRGWLLDIVRALRGQALVLAPGQKLLYHTALALASTYTVTLYALAESLLESLGADRSTADGALNALLAGTVDNLRTEGIPAALTGPLVRADVGTIAAHLGALASVDEDVAEVYRRLARLSLPMLAARGVPAGEIERVLGQDNHHAVNHP